LLQQLVEVVLIAPGFKVVMKGMPWGEELGSRCVNAGEAKVELHRPGRGRIGGGSSLRVQQRFV
jgi:hypothetical protein